MNGFAMRSTFEQYTGVSLRLRCTVTRARSKHNTYYLAPYRRPTFEIVRDSYSIGYLPGSFGINALSKTLQSRHVNHRRCHRHEYADQRAHHANRAADFHLQKLRVRPPTSSLLYRFHLRVRFVASTYFVLYSPKARICAFASPGAS